MWRVRAKGVRGLVALGVGCCIFLTYQGGLQEDEGYSDKLSSLRAGLLTPPQEVTSPSPQHISLGLIIVNLNLTSVELGTDLQGRIQKTLNSIFTYSSGTPLHLVVITEREGAGSVGRAIGEILSADLSNRVLRPRSWNFRVRKGLPPLSVSLVAIGDIILAAPEFVSALRTRSQNKEPGDKYTSSLFYIAPIYHLAFTNLQRILVIDSTDLTFNCDVKDVWSQFSQQSGDSLMSVGLDMAPHYMTNLQDYRKKHPGTQVGMPGRLQGLNTGLVLFSLARMRSSPLYTSYLNREAVTDLMDRYLLKITVGDQDWFTALSFAQPDLFTILPCRFNTQTSLQYWSHSKPVFSAYHQCEPGKPGRIGVFHRNGCGPKPEMCGAEPADVDDYKKFLYLFNFISPCRFWQVLYCAFACDWGNTFAYEDFTCRDAESFP